MKLIKLCFLWKNRKKKLAGILKHVFYKTYIVQEVYRNSFLVEREIEWMVRKRKHFLFIKLGRNYTFYLGFIIFYDWWDKWSL